MVLFGCLKCICASILSIFIPFPCFALVAIFTPFYVIERMGQTMFPCNATPHIVDMNITCNLDLVYCGDISCYLPGSGERCYQIQIDLEWAKTCSDHLIYDVPISIPYQDFNEIVMNDFKCYRSVIEKKCDSQLSTISNTRESVYQTIMIVSIIFFCFGWSMSTVTLFSKWSSTNYDAFDEWFD